MTKKLNNWFFLSLLLVSFLSFNATAQQWDTLGISGFSPNAISSQSIATYNNTVYASFADGTLGDKATVMKFDGTNWVYVGNPGFSAGSTSAHELEIDALTGTIYIAFKDAMNSNGVTVMKFDGTSWSIVGTANISNGETQRVGLALDHNGVPHIGYEIVTSSNPFPVTSVNVRKFNGTSWILLSNVSNGSVVQFADLIIDKSGVPYVAFYEMNIMLEKALHIRTYNGSNWVQYGVFSPSIPSNTDYVSLALDSTTLYVAFQDKTLSDKVKVLKSNGGTWTTVGQAGFSAGAVRYPHILVYNSIPYVAYTDLANSSKTTVMAFDGSSWSNLGNAGFSYGLTSFVKIVASNNNLYVGYKDDGSSFKAVVRKYTLAVSTTELEAVNNTITLFPNPTSNVLTVSSSEQINSIAVLSIDGKFIKNSKNTTISVQDLPNGIYLIQVETPKGFGYQKFIKA